MTLIAASARHVLRLQRFQAQRQRPWKSCGAICTTPRRSFYDGGQDLVVEEAITLQEKQGDVSNYINEYKASCKFFPLIAPKYLISSSYCTKTNIYFQQGYSLASNWRDCYRGRLSWEEKRYWQGDDLRTVMWRRWT